VPVADLPKSARAMSGPVVRTMPSGNAANSRGDIDETVFTELAKQVWQLSLSWQQHGFPPAEVCGSWKRLFFLRPTGGPF